MKIVVRLHGGLRHQSSPHPLTLDVPDAAHVGDVIKILRLEPGEVWLMKLAGQLVDANHPLQSGDELALIPPIGGGCFVEHEEGPG